MERVSLALLEVERDEQPLVAPAREVTACCRVLPEERPARVVALLARRRLARTHPKRLVFDLDDGARVLAEVSPPVHVLATPGQQVDRVADERKPDSISRGTPLRRP